MSEHVPCRADRPGEDAIRHLKALQVDSTPDRLAVHQGAVAVLLDLLRRAGYGAVAEEFDRVPVPWDAGPG